MFSRLTESPRRSRARKVSRGKGRVGGGWESGVRRWGERGVRRVVVVWESGVRRWVRGWVKRVGKSGLGGGGVLEWVKK